MSEQDARARAEKMVADQLLRRGVSDASVLDAMRRTPRHRFVAEELQQDAYGDHPLPIGFGQTISQPYMVARMVELCRLTPRSRVLEVGAGCGYQSAVVSALCSFVWAVELISELAAGAEATLDALGVSNVRIIAADGTEGLGEHAPYDAILVAAGANAVPEALKEQLSDGGRLVIPVGPRSLQVLHVVERHGDLFNVSEDTACRFVELKGAYGWSS